MEISEEEYKAYRSKIYSFQDYWACDFTVFQDYWPQKHEKNCQLFDKDTRYLFKV